MSFTVAIVGTGAVGSTLLEIMEEREFPLDDLRLLATHRSAGNKMTFRGKEYTIEETTNKSFDGVDLAFFAGGKASELFAREAVKRGSVVIDNGSAFRMDPDVPLVIPEVNPEDLKNHKGIIANPNCSTIQMVVGLKPLHDISPIKHVVVSTYQAVSGAGVAAMDELEKQTRDILDGKEPKIEVFQHQIAMNLIPHIDVFVEKGYTKEEMKMVKETQKIMHDDQMRITATTVRVPIMRSHSESVLAITKDKITLQQAREAFKVAPGVVLQDDPSKNEYPMPYFTSNTDEVYIGRVREDLAFDNGISFFVVADQLRKGAATNAIQIAEKMLEYNLL